MCGWRRSEKPPEIACDKNSVKRFSNHSIIRCPDLVTLSLCLCASVVDFSLLHPERRDGWHASTSENLSKNKKDHAECDQRHMVLFSSSVFSLVSSGTAYLCPEWVIRAMMSLRLSVTVEPKNASRSAWVILAKVAFTAAAHLSMLSALG